MQKNKSTFVVNNHESIYGERDNIGIRYILGLHPKGTPTLFLGMKVYIWMR